jgi:hypothetical protein
VSDDDLKTLEAYVTMRGHGFVEAIERFDAHFGQWLREQLKCGRCQQQHLPTCRSGLLEKVDPTTGEPLYEHCPQRLTAETGPVP